MQTYHAETTISGDGTLIIRELPFRPGDKVQVTVRARPNDLKRHKCYPLRGKPIRYVAPFDSVTETSRQ